MNMQHRELQIHSRNDAARTCDFVASTDAVDSYDEIVDQSWNLDRYKANPVVLFGHQSRDLPIGQCTRCEVQGGKLVATIRFATAKANPQAELVWQSIREGSLRAVSVGFRSNTIREETRNGKPVSVLADNELYEISVVPIPANPDALARMHERASGNAPPIADEPGGSVDLGSLGDDERNEIDTFIREMMTPHTPMASPVCRSIDNEPGPDLGSLDDDNLPLDAA